MTYAEATQAYQAQLEHHRAGVDEPECTDEMLGELAEDLRRAKQDLKVAWLELGINS